MRVVLFFYCLRKEEWHCYFRRIVVTFDDKDDRIGALLKKGNIMRSSSERQVATDGTGITCLSYCSGPSYVS